MYNRYMIISIKFGKKVLKNSDFLWYNLLFFGHL